MKVFGLQIKAASAAALALALAAASPLGAAAQTKFSPPDRSKALRAPDLNTSVINANRAAERTPRPQDWRTVDPDNLLVIDTNKGRIIVDLWPLAAPASVQQIKTLARQHFYDGLSFFRVIDTFMAQTGDPKNTGEGNSTLPNVKAEFSFRRDRSTPFVPVAGMGGRNVGFIGEFPVQTQPDALMSMTADGKASAWGLYCPGVAGMARDGVNVDSNNSQFFLMRQTYPSLEHNYTAFGRVVVGEEVVRAIKVGEPVEAPQDAMTRVRLGSDLPPAERPVVRVLDPASPAFQALADQLRIEKGSDFSICDIDIPVQTH